MILDIVLLIVGFILLIKGANIFVGESVNISKKLKIPSVVIGLTVVSIGTSLPETVVSITASVKGANALAIGNIVGSNIFNLLFIVGLCALIKPFMVNFKEIAKDLWIAAGAAAALLLIMVLCGDYITRPWSLVLFAAFMAYIIILVRNATKNKDGDVSEDSAEDGDTAALKPLWKSIIGAVLGCAFIIAGGQLTVNGAENIAVAMGISERLIGLTVLAIGTSLPELVTSLTACIKRENSIALGNVVGSNIFNILFILGAAGVISPLAIDVNLIFDLIVLNVCSLVSIFFIYSGKKLVRFEGVLMVAAYIGYMVFICIKN